MYLPKTFENFSKNYPEIVEHYDKLGRFAGMPDPWTTNPRILSSWVSPSA